MSEQQFSRVYLDRPAYADYESPEKFQAIIGISCPCESIQEAINYFRKVKQHD